MAGTQRYIKYYEKVIALMEEQGLKALRINVKGAKDGTDGKDGVYQVKDTMNSRFVNRIDILESPGVKPYKFVDAKIKKANLNEDIKFISN